MIVVFRSVILFLVLSGLVHIFSILAVPFFAEQKVWQKVIERTEPRRITALKDYKEALEILGQADPAMAYANCQFSLENGPVTITADGATNFWNATLFNSDAQVIYSLHDDVSQTNQLNLEVSLKGTQSQEKTDDTSSLENDSSLPVPSSPPSLEEEEAKADIAGEDDLTLRARISHSQVFVVLKIFKASKHHAKLIQETFATAECK